MFKERKSQDLKRESACINIGKELHLKEAEIMVKKRKPQKKEGKKLILVIILSVILLGGVGAYQILRNKEIILASRCFAVTLEDPSYCTDKICDPKNVNYCTDKICDAEKGLCTSVVCLDDFYFLEALRKSDESLCSKIDGTKKDHLGQNDPYYKVICKAVVKEDITICDEIPSSERYNKICQATLNKDTSSCNEFSDIALKLDCLDYIYSILAIKNNDALYCKKIKELAKIPGAEKNPSLTGQYSKDSYLRCMGTITHDLKYCGGGHLCFGDKESIANCLQNKFYGPLGEVIKIEQLKNSRANNTAWEEFKIKTRIWWMQR